MKEVFEARVGSRGPDGTTNDAQPGERTTKSTHTPGQRAQSASIDKSVLTLPEARPLRDRVHAKFVATHPCLICGRRPSDAHHLRFMQSRALGRKVSDEFTVPCAGVITAKSITVVMRSRGGKISASIRRTSPAPFGWRPIRFPSLKKEGTR